MIYKVLKNNKFITGDYSIVPYRDEDKFKIMEWRNKQMDVLRQKNILTIEDQKNYYQGYIAPSFSQDKPKIILFSFLEKNSCIGYGGLTNVDWESKRVELSFMVDDQRASKKEVYEQDFTSFITLMKMVVFDDMLFNRIFTETYDIRPHHISILEKNGFRPEGRMKEHVLIDGNFIDSVIHGYLKSDYNA